jgi:hypothetical protein
MYDTENVTSYSNISDSSINELTDCFSTTKFLDNELNSLINTDSNTWINPFLQNIMKSKHSKRKRQNNHNEYSKKYRIDYMIPIENVIQSICGKTDIDDLTKNELKNIIIKKKLFIPNTSKMIKEELKLAVENELYYTEYFDENDEECVPIKVQNKEKQMSARAQRLHTRNKQRDIILEQQKRHKEVRNSIYDLSNLFDTSL